MDERCYLMGTTDSFDRLYLFRKRCEVCDRSELNYFGVELTGIRRDEKFKDKKAEKVFKFLFSDANEFSLNPPYACYDEWILTKATALKISNAANISAGNWWKDEESRV